MEIKNEEILYWKNNDEWWDVDEEKREFILTNKAPKKAKESFEKYKNYLRDRKKVSK